MIASKAFHINKLEIIPAALFQERCHLSVGFSLALIRSKANSHWIGQGLALNFR
jgi:hypothetical protein